MTFLDNHARLGLFKKSKRINNKTYKWRYTVIPSDDLARMGFYFDPIEQNSIVWKDAINCIYCQRHTHDLKRCRSKSKDPLETISNILMQHLNGNNLNCPISYLRLKMIKDYRYNLGTSNWKDDPIFKDPFDLVTRNIFRTSFIELESMDWDTTMLNNAINAGLIKFDESLIAFEKTEANYLAGFKTFFCIYCKNMIDLDTRDDIKPIEKHYLACHNGHCYFFKKLVESFPEFKDLKRLHKFNIIDETDKNDSMDSIVHNSLLYENLTTRENISENDNDEMDLDHEKIINTPKSMTQILTDAIRKKNKKEEDNDEVKHIESTGSVSQNEISPNISYSNNESNVSNIETTVDPSSDKDEQIPEDDSSSFNDDPTVDSDPSYHEDVEEENSNGQKINVHKEDTNSTEKKDNSSKKKNKSGHLDRTIETGKDTEHTGYKPVRKRRKLLDKSPQKISSNAETTFGDGTSEEPSNISNNKDLILNFKEHVNRKKDVTRNNKILDDSSDEFSFSENGTNAFNISALENIESLSPHKKSTTEDKQESNFKTSELKESNIAVNVSIIIRDKTEELHNGTISKVESPIKESPIESNPAVPVEFPHDQSLSKHDTQASDLLHSDLNNDTVSTPHKDNSSSENKPLQMEANNLQLTANVQDETIKPPTEGAVLTKMQLDTDKKEVTTASKKIPIDAISLDTVSSPIKTPIKKEKSDPPEELSTPTKTLKIFDKKDSNLNDFNRTNTKTTGRTLSGANTAVPKNKASEDELKEKLNQISVDNDFLTSDSESDTSLSSVIPTPKVNPNPSSPLLSSREEQHYRRLRQV